MSNNELLKQWKQDVTDYHAPHLLWEWETASLIESDKWAACWDGYPMEWETTNYRRKESAALPFDLERAKDGDVVEIFVGSEWKTSTIASSAYDYIPINEYHLLRMKFPPKVNHE